jgi:hypothetical protein
MKHSNEDVLLFEKCKNEYEHSQNTFNFETKKFEDFILLSFSNILEGIDCKFFNFRFHSYSNLFEFSISFYNLKYYWSDFFTINILIDQNKKINFEPRESSGGYQKNICIMEALTIKSNIYNEVLSFSKNINKELLINKLKHLSCFHKDFNEKSEKLRDIKKLLAEKENYFKANKLLKFFKIQDEGRKNKLIKHILNDNLWNSELTIVTIEHTSNYSNFTFRNNLIKMKNNNKLSLTLNDKRISKSSLFELLDKEFYSSSTLCNTIYNIPFIQGNKIKLNADTNGLFAQFSLDELLDIFKTQINIDSF